MSFNELEAPEELLSHDSFSALHKMFPEDWMDEIIDCEPRPYYVLLATAWNSNNLNCYFSYLDKERNTPAHQLKHFESRKFNTNPVAQQAPQLHLETITNKIFCFQNFCDFSTVYSASRIYKAFFHRENSFWLAWKMFRRARFYF